MKTRNEKIRTALFVIAGLMVGFTAGILVSDTKIDNEAAKGTISKVNNYRNVKISDEDVKLRSELLSDTSLCNGIKKYLNFHYITASSMTSALETAIKASEGLADFKSMNGELIDGLNTYYKSMAQLRSEIMMAIVVLNALDNTDPSDVYMAIQNANTSISQMNYKDNSVISFLDEAGRYLASKNGNNVQMLNKAYNHLLMVQGVKAAAVNDKPRMKYLSEKQLTASAGELNAFDKENLSINIENDVAQLKLIGIESSESLKAGFTDVSNDIIASNLTLKSLMFESNIMTNAAQMDFSNLNLDQSSAMGSNICLSCLIN